RHPFVIVQPSRMGAGASPWAREPGCPAAEARSEQLRWRWPRSRGPSRTGGGTAAGASGGGAPAWGSGRQHALCGMAGRVGCDEHCFPPLPELTRRRLNLTWVCLRDDLNTEFFVEPQDLRCFESLSHPDGRWMTRLWFVAVPEHAFVAARGEHEQHPCAVDARVLEAVPGAARNEDEIARAGKEGACPAEDLKLAGQNIEGFVGSGMNMGDGSAARRHRGIDQAKRAVRGLARCLDRVGVTSEPCRRTFTCGNMDG